MRLGRCCGCSRTIVFNRPKPLTKAVTSGKEVAAFAILGAENIIAEIINRTYVQRGG